MTSLLSQTFSSRPVVIPYFMVGYPANSDVANLAAAAVRAGARIVELGVPFSDPLADGATIQRAAQAALAHGVNLDACFAAAARLRARAPEALPVLMGYYNVFLHAGLPAVCRRARESSVAGFIVPDLPPEEAGDFLSAARAESLDLVFLVAPTSTEARLAAVARVASGFVYCVSLTGVTGARAALPADLANFIARVRRHIHLPLAVGFGLSRPEHVRQVAAVADGAVVGSAIIDLLERTPPEQRAQAVAAYVREMRG